MIKHKISLQNTIRIQLVVETFGLYEPTNQNFIKVPKVVEPTNKKMLL